MATLNWFTIVVLIAIITHQTTADKSQQCSYKGYALGGVLSKISKINNKTPPQFETTVLQTALDYFNKGSGVTAATLGAIDAVGDVLKAAPQMTAAIGCVTVALGFLNKSPSPQDILNKVTESVNMLTEEVNVMMDQMKDYADVRDLQLEKRLMNNEYKQLFDQWVQCSRKFTQEESENCQKAVEDQIRSSRYHFQPLHDKFGQKFNGKLVYNPNFNYRKSAGTWQWMNKHCGVKEYAGAECLSHYEAKRLEIGIIAFRDYATLHLLALKTLEASYKSHPINTDTLACKNYRRYLGDIKDRADMYVRYARWAYEWDYIR